MSVDSVSGYQWSYRHDVAPSGSQSTYAEIAGGVTPHAFGRNDPLNQYLTAEDRSTILSTTGLDVRENGEILCPVSMGSNEFGAALDTVGQIAADRANGSPAGAISAAYVQKLMASFLYKLNNNLPEFSS